MKHIAPQLDLPLPDPNNRVVECNDQDLERVLGELKADGFWPGTMERITGRNAAWRITSTRLSELNHEEVTT